MTDIWNSGIDRPLRLDLFIYNSILVQIHKDQSWSVRLASLKLYYQIYVTGRIETHFHTSNTDIASCARSKPYIE